MILRRLLPRQGGGVSAALTSALVLAGCSIFSGCSVNSAQITMQLLIKDGVLRDAGSECNGTGPFSGIHVGAPYDILDDQGGVRASGSLPRGTAVKTFDIDFGELAEPTACRLEITVDGLSELDGLSLLVDGHQPIPIKHRSTEKERMPTAVIP